MPVAQLQIPVIALVTDRQVCRGEERLLDAVEQALEGGVNLVQMREKDLSQNDMLALARQLRELTKGRALLLINGDLNVALIARADGAHLSEAQSGLAPQAARQGLVGCSVHDVAGAQRAARARANLLVAGPVYPTQTHPSQAPAGTELIEHVTSAVDIPVLGIGGITAETAAEVIEAGASGVAVVREILGAPDPADAARRLRDAVLTAWTKRSAPPTPTSARESKQ